MRSDLRKGFIEAAEALNPTHAVTFAFNATVPFDHQGLPIRGKDAKTCLRSVMMRLEHHLLGRRWSSKTEGRTRGLFLPENKASNVHWHGLIKISPENIERFEAALTDSIDTRTGEVIQSLPAWKKVIPSGSSCIRRVSSAGGFGGYMTKDGPDQDDLVVF